MYMYLNTLQIVKKKELIVTYDNTDPAIIDFPDLMELVTTYPQDGCMVPGVDIATIQLCNPYGNLCS